MTGMLEVNTKDAMTCLPFACSLVYDVLVVVVPETTRQLFVVHLWLVLPHSPTTSYLKRSIWISRIST